LLDCGAGVPPAPWAPQAELLLAHEDAVAALRHGVAEDRGQRLAVDRAARPWRAKVGIPEVAHRVNGLSAPRLALLPAPRPARPGFLQAEVELLDVLLLAQPRAAVFHDDATVLEHVAVVGHVDRHARVL